LLRRIPSIGTPISPASIVRGLAGGSCTDRFSGLLREASRREYCVLTGSGTTALYLILRALREISGDGRSEVLMPAYTAPSLVLAMREAETEPVLTEVSVETFNQDLDAMTGKMGTGTLAVMPVHMYGLVEDLSGLCEAASSRGVFVVEDAASAQGSSVNGQPAGSMGDVSFFSFNRGKNLSTVAGGAVLTDRRDIAEAVQAEEKKLRSPDGKMKLHMLLKAVGLSLIWRPALYSMLRPIARGYRYAGLHDHIELSSYTEFQASLGCSLIDRGERIFSSRFENGSFLYDSLKGCEHLTLPRLSADAYTVYNQFPVLVNASVREGLLVRLEEAGLEPTTLYPLPIHKIYDLGFPDDPDPFPAASRVASEILLLPVHPGVSRASLARAAGVMEESGRMNRRQH